MDWGLAPKDTWTESAGVPTQQYTTEERSSAELSRVTRNRRFRANYTKLARYRFVHMNQSDVQPPPAEKPIPQTSWAIWDGRNTCFRVIFACMVPEIPSPAWPFVEFGCGILHQRATKSSKVDAPTFILRFTAELPLPFQPRPQHQPLCRLNREQWLLQQQPTWVHPPVPRLQ